MALFKKVVLLPYKEYEQLLKAAGRASGNKPVHDLDQIVKQSLTDSLLQDSVGDLKPQIIKGEIGSGNLPTSELTNYSDNDEDTNEEDIIPTKEPIAYSDWSSRWEPL